MSRFSAIGFWVKKSAGEVYEPDFQAYLDALITPLSANQKTYINDFYVGIKTVLDINLLSEWFDFLTYLGNETSESAYKNLVKRLHDGAAAGGTVTHTPYEGTNGNGTSSYIDTNYNAATQGANYSLNSACLITYSRTNNTTSAADLGGRTGTDYTAIYPYTSRVYACRIHQGAGGGLINTTNTIGTYGMMILQRIGVSSLVLYHNKSKYTRTSAATSTNIPSTNYFAHARSFSGSPEAVSNRQLSLIGACKPFSDAQANGFTDQFETLMDKNGKGVL